MEAVPLKATTMVLSLHPIRQRVSSCSSQNSSLSVRLYSPRAVRRFRVVLSGWCEGEPLTRFGDPLTRFGDPLTGLGEPLTTLGDPWTRLGDPLSKLGDPFTRLGEMRFRDGFCWLWGAPCKKDLIMNC